MRLNRQALVKFYDERDNAENGRGADVSSITALWGEDLLLSLLMHYWSNMKKADTEIISYSCTTGKKKGPRLDGWLLQTIGTKRNLFQVEIKNWAAYSMGGKELPLKATTGEVDEFRKHYWEKYFQASQLPEEVEKVMRHMEPPAGFKNYKPIPLICFWFFVSDNIKNPYSIRRYSHNRSIHVFSASAYLRSLKTETVDLYMPRAERRLATIQSLGFSK